MNLAAIFVIICGAFVAIVLVLVVWLIINGLKDEAKRRIRPADDQLNKP
jgi:hypothetical protein